jgi:hypothetical protein
MKTAEERAAELMAQYHEGGALTRMTFVGALAVAFKEYARDQRHACAEAVPVLGDGVAKDCFPSPRRERVDAIAVPDVSPEPTPEAIADFNARQMESRRIYLMGYVEVLPEHAGEGMEKAAERFPLKRIANSPEVMMLGELRAVRWDGAGPGDAGGGQVELCNVRHPVLTYTDIRRLAAWVDAPRYVEDVPLEEEEG